MASDIHLGAPNMNPLEMTNALAATIFPKLPGCDLFFINGDLYDGLIHYDNHGFDPIYEILLSIFDMCERHGITLRVLQGTHSHDRSQCKRLLPFYRKTNATFDFKLIEGISFEVLTIKGRDLRFLYVQDDLPYKSSDEIVAVINDKLQELGWDYVDYACMHGFFEFTFPQNVSTEGHIVFREEQFPFVKKFIDVGHVHQHRIRGKVISNGSFDRLVFGDEEPKGCVEIIDHGHHAVVHFVENTDAAVYDTLVFSEEDDTVSIREKISNHLALLKTNRKVSLRFSVPSDDQYAAIKSWLKEIRPDIRVERKKLKDTKDRQMMPASTLVVKKERRAPPTLKTIASHVLNHIHAHVQEDYALTVPEIEVYLGIT